MFIEEKKVVAIDLGGEYTEYRNKKDKEKGNKDLRAYLAKTIEEYEELLKITEDEQQKQRIEKLLD